MIRSGLRAVAVHPPARSARVSAPAIQRRADAGYHQRAAHGIRVKYRPRDNSTDTNPTTRGLHDVGRHDRQRQTDGGVALGVDRAQEVDGPIVQISGRWPSSRWVGCRSDPPAAVAPGLADPGLVLQPDFKALGFDMGGGSFGDQIAAFMSTSAWARKSASGCTGRVFCEDRSQGRYQTAAVEHRSTQKDSTIFLCDSPCPHCWSPLPQALRSAVHLG